MTPVVYSAASRIIVDAFEALPEDQKSGGYWSNDAVTPVRGEIKNHYIAEQQYSCVYCAKQIVTDNNSLWDAEHVISRDKAARFMFTSENLAVSCRDCNIAKGEQEVRRNATRKSFPNKSVDYRIVHPHFDDYADHIRWFGVVCAPTSEKGKKTLVVCNLTRFSANLLGITGVISDPYFDQLVGQLLNAKTRVETLGTLAALSVLAQRIPQD